MSYGCFSMTEFTVHTRTYICITVICMIEVGGRDSILWSPFHLHLFCCRIPLAVYHRDREKPREVVVSPELL